MTFFELASNAAVMAQGYKFSQIAMNVTKLADPTAASITLVKKIAIECLPPQVKYPVKCAIFALQCCVVLNSSPLMITSATAVALTTANQIAEAMLNDL